MKSLDGNKMQYKAHMSNFIMLSVWFFKEEYKEEAKPEYKKEEYYKKGKLTS